MQITIIGAGNMARGIATRALAGGHTVEISDRNSDKARVLVEELNNQGSIMVASGILQGAMVILAIPYAAASEVAEQYQDQLAGKVIVDISNPVDFQTFELITPPGSSAGQEIAKLLPGSRVVKAFNTTFATTLFEGKVGGQPLDVWVAGDDTEAKDLVKQLITDGDMRAIDAGPLARAHHIEAMQLLHMAAQQQLVGNFQTALKIMN